MRYLPVHWSEGMFLRPQHFQAAERHWDERLSSGQHWDQHYHYGIKRIEISPDAIQHQQFEVTRCEARLMDGTPVVLAEGQQPLRVDLAEAFQQHSELTVFLAAPKLSLGRANVGSQSTQRYRELIQKVQDESAGGNDQEIQFRQLNARLMLSTDDSAGFEQLPIAKLKRAGDQEAVPQIDKTYAPPLLAVDAWPAIGIDILRAIYDIVGAKMDLISKRAVERKINLTSQEPGDLDDLFMLTTLNAAYGTLGCLAFAEGVHPLVAYTELCRIVGMLSIFGETRKTPEIPRYDHDNLADIFRWAMQFISSLLGAQQQPDFDQRFFVGTDLGMQVAIEEKWLHSGWQWFVGVFGENVTDREARALLMPGKLNWKMGSGRQVATIFQYGMPGVELDDLLAPPRALPGTQGWIYYQVKREGGAWNDVLATQTLEIRFADHLIGNLSQLKGQQRLEVLTESKRAMLQFALFAVRPTNPT